MRCMHILPMNKLSGAEKLALILCKQMDRYEPIVVCGGEQLKDVFERNSIKSYCIDFKSNNLLIIAKELSVIIKKNNIKIIHAHDNNASISTYLAKKIYIRNIKIISHIHNCYPWLEGKSINKIIDSVVRRRYNHNIACGKLVYDYYKKHTDYVNLENTSILSNAIDIEEIDSSQITREDQLYIKYNIPKDKTILGFIGRLSEQKGIIPFIKEFINHKDKFRDCKILIIGSGEQDLEVKRLIEQYNLEEYFIFTGYQDDTYKFYPIIDIFFLPSLYEGLPMVLLEAMSFKKPIISMNVGSINEIVINGYNGYLVDGNDYDMFIKRLRDLKENKEKILIYGENSLKIIKENYNIKNYKKLVEDLYDLVLSKDKY